jgi:hypothetical protein
MNNSLMAIWGACEAIIKNESIIEKIHFLAGGDSLSRGDSFFGGEAPSRVGVTH